MKDVLMEALLPHMEVSSFTVEDRIAVDLSKCATLFYLEKGAVVVESASLISKTRRVGVLRSAKCFIGLEYIFMNDPLKTRTSITGISEGTIYKIHRDKLAKLLEEDLRLQRAILIELMARELAESHAQLMVQLEAALIQEPHDRLREVLKEVGTLLGEEVDRGISVPIKTASLSKLVGLSGDSTRRAAAKLMKAGEIAKTSRGHYLIFN